MCGIAGLVGADGLHPDDRARAIRMREVIRHRGPDEAGLWGDDRALLAHRRLSIVDLNSGQQPLANEDRTIWIAFNGEIYNHAEIRRDLEAHGHAYRTRSDTETIVHAYEQWGDECVHRLRGMFVFAVWDAPKRRLLLVRDRLGIKPLYWARVGDTLLFGSEIKAILASDLITPQANREVLSEILSTRYTSATDTMFRGIHKLLPGHLLVYERGGITTRQYWDVPAGRPEGLRDAGRRAGLPACRDGDIVARFRSLLEESVRLRLMSDVPLGMFLSGGIDSSAIAALMARMIDRPLQTFSVAFKERAFNELAYAREVARAIGADSHEIVIDDRDFFGALPKLVWHEDEPIAHASSVPLYFVSALAQRHVTVVLTGEGSDELLAGYGKYLRLAWNWRAGTVYERFVPQAVRTSIANLVVPLLPGALARHARRTFLAMDRTPESMVFDNFAAIRLDDQRSLLAPALRGTATREQAYGPSRAYFDRLNGQSTLLDRLLYADIKTYLVELLMKQDQMSMAASIESRVPFLDHKLVEFAAQLPDEWKLNGFTTKRVLRESMKGLLPESILNRPKMGFPVPFAAWTRGPWNAVARDVLLDSRSRQRGIIDPMAVDRLLRDHTEGRTDGGDRIWSLLNLELWHRTFIDNEGVQVLPAPSLRRSVPDMREHHGGRASASDSHEPLRGADAPSNSGGGGVPAALGKSGPRAA
ncbi:MAG: asparagine synthase (glutamine-hydrolyzing) [Acidobacteria bacterium 13_1_20CM_2_65_9]|nr:MAG: asparagine synthase (glutamine-hydrolyzing) [Acidobacteria bacterium 13_1_20CM_2_65_9]